jgi:hypothetical protein
LQSDPKPIVEEEKSILEEGKGDIVITEEELEGFRIIRAIVSKVINPERVVHRKVKAYVGILLDDNNRKPICRVYFNGKQKFLGIFDSDKKEIRILIDRLADLYKQSDQLISTIQTYENLK